MKNSAQRIRTSHVGRLPVPSGFEETALRLARGEVGGEEVAAQVVPVVADVVKRQVEIGLDCIGDGEYWSALDIRWFDQQMTGLVTRPLKPGDVGSMRESTRERDVFRTLYADMDRVGTIACVPGERLRPPTRERVIVSGPIKTRGTAATERQLDCFKAAIARSGVAVDEASRDEFGMLHDVGGMTDHARHQDRAGCELCLFPDLHLVLVPHVRRLK